jgi:2-polyprenyl-3-methyl-5-hydroxy-6-metoxy-1,4-benzoquinol methylase
MDGNLTARQERERGFFDEYWLRFPEAAQVNLDPIAGKEHRPWNPYWHVFEVARQRYAAGARTLLDVGCGGGTNAAIFALLGFDVTGFDISPRCIETARQVAAAHHLADRTHFSVQAAECLDYEDGSFDIVVGIDILHHVEISPAVAECLRVLKPGGTALFREFVEVPAFDRVRNTALVRFFFSKEKCLDPVAHITEDERKLTDSDIRLIRDLCPAMTERRFLLLARLDQFLRRPWDRTPSTLEQVDYWLARHFHGMNKLGGSVVLELTKLPGPALDGAAKPADLFHPQRQMSVVPADDMQLAGSHTP